MFIGLDKPAKCKIIFGLNFLILFLIELTDKILSCFLFLKINL